MTNEEAIEYLTTIKIFSIQDGYTDEAREAIDIAIKSIEDRAKLREAVKNIKANMKSYCDMNCPYSEKQREVMCKACRMGDAIDMVDDYTEGLI